MSLKTLRLAALDLLTVARRAYHNFILHECGPRGAALAYYAFFSIFPLLLLFISGLGFLLEAGWPIATNAQTAVLDAAEKVAPDFSDLLARSIDAARSARGGTGILGIVMLVWTASNMFAHATLAFDAVWGIDGPRKIGAIIRWRLDALGLVLATGLLLVAYTLFDTALDLLIQYAARLPGSVYWLHVWTSLVSTAVTALLFGLLYRVAPRAAPGWADIWPGALLAAVAWEALKKIFSWYATSLVNWTAIYGPVAGVIVLLLWLYLSAQIILFGAEFSAAFAHLKQERRTPATKPDQKTGQGCVQT